MAGECTKTVRHTKVKVEENKAKAIFLNPEREIFQVSTIDGCLIKEGPRADCLVSKQGSASVLVELKGTDVSHACDQLFSSVNHPDVRSLLEERIGFLIVCRRYPRIDTFVQRAKQKAMSRFKAGFHVEANPSAFDIERVVAIDGPY